MPRDPRGVIPTVCWPVQNLVLAVGHEMANESAPAPLSCGQGAPENTDLNNHLQMREILSESRSLVEKLHY